MQQHLSYEPSGSLEANLRGPKFLKCPVRAYPHTPPGALRFA